MSDLLPIRAVIFDLDGTLVDHISAARGALRAWLPELGAPYSDPAADSWLRIEEWHLPAWRSGEISFAEQRRRRLRDFLPLIDVAVPSADDELDATFVGYAEHYGRGWSAYPDAPQAVTAITDGGLRTAVLTNGTSLQQSAKLIAVGLAGRVGPVFAAEQLSAMKPDPRSYLTVCEWFGLSPPEVLHVGDNHELDVVAPRLAGLRAVHVDRYHAGPHDESERVTSLTQLPAYITRLL